MPRAAPAVGAAPPGSSHCVKLSADEVWTLIRRLVILTEDVGAFLFGPNCVDTDKQACRENTPSSI